MAFPNDGKKFEAGKSGNPNGRPKKLPDLDELLAEVLCEENNGIEAAREILIALRTKAKKGDIRAAEVLLNRGYGLPKQLVNFNHSGSIVLHGMRQKENQPLLNGTENGHGD